jgi:hypothetical protein
MGLISGRSVTLENLSCPTERRFVRKWRRITRSLQDDPPPKKSPWPVQSAPRDSTMRQFWWHCSFAFSFTGVLQQSASEWGSREGAKNARSCPACCESNGAFFVTARWKTMLADDAATGRGCTATEDVAAANKNAQACLFASPGIIQFPVQPAQ